ncbi:hypothetical protein HDU87_000738 [Geranomyces variabilis]|uniref:Uncharacterized protein n=1 Tax=Geranomyces variabilis TaxID=109894 RepID=A0AAD5TN60_9FUNG|nr:hypothetical protein HDU87_000738 [Geranomyces variabilis]
MAVELSFVQDTPTSPFHAEFQKQQTIIQLWTALYGLGTFPYVILVQIRFRVVKAVFKYHKNWVYIYTVRTLFQAKRPTSRYNINTAGKSAAILRTAAGSTTNSLSTPTSRVTSLMPTTKALLDSGISDVERVASPYGAAAAPSSAVENQASEFGEHEPARPLNPKPKSVKRGKSFKRAEKNASSDFDEEAGQEHGPDVDNQLETFGVTSDHPHWPPHWNPT